MRSNIKDLLRQLNEQLEFQTIMAEMLKDRPVIPDYKPCPTAENEQMLLARIKYEAGRRDGFDFLYRSLTGQRIAP